jgi:succinate dehydrogenase / fumarate reductase cytochrome b subunit
VVPLSVFVFAHLWVNARALQGQARFDSIAVELARVPARPYVEAIVLVALGFHAVVGVKLALRPKAKGHEVTLPPLSTTLQRTTGLIALAFIGLHVWQTWAQQALGRLAPEQLYPALSESLSSTFHGVPVTALIYLIGVAAVALHVANGLWRVGVSWGLTVSPRAQRASAVVLGVVAAAAFLLGANTVVHFATGAGLTVFGAP